MDARQRFIRWVCVTVGLWVAVNLILWGFFNREGMQDTTVALTSLTADIGVGFLTVYALTWAASEFAAAGDKPDIRLRGSSSKTNVSGKTDFSATFQMSLENVGRKAGHNIHLVMRIPALPELIECSFNSGPLQMFGTRARSILRPASLPCVCRLRTISSYTSRLSLWGI